MVGGDVLMWLQTCALEDFRSYHWGAERSRPGSGNLCLFVLIISMQPFFRNNLSCNFPYTMFLFCFCIAVMYCNTILCCQYWYFIGALIKMMTNLSMYITKLGSLQPTISISSDCGIKINLPVRTKAINFKTFLCDPEILQDTPECQHIDWKIYSWQIF